MESKLKVDPKARVAHALGVVSAAMDQTLRDLQLTPREQTRVRSRLKKYLSDRLKAPAIIKRVPRVGDRIYVDSQLYLSHGADDFDGGIATVTEVTPKKSVSPFDPRSRFVIHIAERPGHGYYWEGLADRQAELKKRYGTQRAHPSPDLHPSANTWD